MSGVLLNSQCRETLRKSLKPMSGSLLHSQSTTKEEKGHFNMYLLFVMHFN